MSQNISMLSQPLRSHHKVVCGSLIDLSDTFCLHFASTRWGKKAVTNNLSGGKKQFLLHNKGKALCANLRSGTFNCPPVVACPHFFWNFKKEKKNCHHALCVRRPALQLSPSTLYVGANQVSDCVITMTFSWSKFLIVG